MGFPLPEKFNTNSDTPWLFYGVVGSQAHGLAGPDSDEDYAGVFLGAPETFLGVNLPNKSQLTYSHNDPDITLHELGKFCGLALSCNPTLMELLWLPNLQVNQDLDLDISWLIDNKHKLLSEPKVRNAFSGYALQQANRLVRRNAEGKDGFSADTAKRTSKHARHCFRLLLMATQLLETGNMIVDVSDYRDELYAMGDLAVNAPNEFYKEFERRDAIMKNTVSVLPESPDCDAVNSWLINLRKQGLQLSN